MTFCDGTQMADLEIWIIKIMSPEKKLAFWGNENPELFAR